jgi:hypothetical protein
MSARGYEIHQKRAGVILLFLFHDDNRPLSATFPKVTVSETTSSQYIDGLEETTLFLLRRWSRLESFQMSHIRLQLARKHLSCTFTAHHYKFLFADHDTESQQYSYEVVKGEWQERALISMIGLVPSAI